MRAGCAARSDFKAYSRRSRDEGTVKRGGTRAARGAGAPAQAPVGCGLAGTTTLSGLQLTKVP